MPATSTFTPNKFQHSTIFMKMEFPISFSLQDDTNVKVDEMDDHINFTFILDKPTGQTDSFTWVPNPANEGKKQEPPKGEEDPQRREAIELFLQLREED